MAWLITVCVLGEAFQPSLICAVKASGLYYKTLQNIFHSKLVSFYCQSQTYEIDKHTSLVQNPYITDP
jgi:hypothetical protein